MMQPFANYMTFNNMKLGIGPLLINGRNVGYLNGTVTVECGVQTKVVEALAPMVQIGSIPIQIYHRIKTQLMQISPQNYCEALGVAQSSLRTWDGVTDEYDYYWETSPASQQLLQFSNRAGSTLQSVRLDHTRIKTGVDALVVGKPTSGSTGPIATHSINAAGTGYSASAVVTVTNGANDATITINTVDTGGEVLTYTILSAGTACTVATGVATTYAGAGTGFRINILTVASSITLVEGVDYLVDNLLGEVIAIPGGAITANMEAYFKYKCVPPKSIELAFDPFGLLPAQNEIDYTALDVKTGQAVRTWMPKAETTVGNLTMKNNDIWLYDVTIEAVFDFTPANVNYPLGYTKFAIDALT